MGKCCATALQVLGNRLCPIRYVDHNGADATSYPNNPNGSFGAMAALCSVDGRHLAMMPHPGQCHRERRWGGVGVCVFEVCVSVCLRCVCVFEVRVCVCVRSV